MTYTPGPWKAKNEPVARANGEIADFYSITGPDDSHVCYVTDTPYRTGDLGDDARLIGAVVDLLKCAEILAALDARPGRTFPTQADCDFARAAIAKAKGE